MLKDALGSYRGSLAELDRVIDEEPNSAEAYYDRANVKSGRGDVEGAINDYSKAIELGLRLRERFLAYGNRGIARVAIEENKGAFEDFTAIIEASPKNKGILRTALFNRAMLREKTGDVEGAAMDYQQGSGIVSKSKTGE